MKVLLLSLIAWWAFFHTIALLTLPFNTLLLSKGGVFGKDPGLFGRVLFLYGDLLSLLHGAEPLWFFAIPPILQSLLRILSGLPFILPWRLSAPDEGEH